MSISASESDDTPTCIAVEFVDHVTGTTATSEEFCFSEDELAQAGRRPIDGIGEPLSGVCLEAPEICTGTETLGEDFPLWLEETCAWFEQDSSGPVNGGCACHVETRSTGSATGFAFLLLGLLRRRTRSAAARTDRAC